MRTQLKILGLAAFAGGLLGLAGCVADDDGGGGPVVYGDVGYAAPWYYPGVWFGGGRGDYGHPPFHGDRDHPGIPDRARPVSRPSSPREGGGGHSAPSRGGGGRDDHRH